MAEEEIGMSYETIDPILHLLVDKKLTPKAAAKRLGIAEKHVNRVKEMMEANAHKRSMPPVAGHLATTCSVFSSIA